MAVTHNYIFDTVPTEIRHGSVQDAQRWKELIAEANKRRKIVSIGRRIDALEALDREAHGFLKIVKERQNAPA